ncbi:Histidine Kinase A (phosphoacceptor) domain containing protein [Sporothrix schenckii 1099-18]|uniref:Histidine Kinase A (Phosphoacceptor) domain containing protein n=1 Tax=Sporothrix schenckii 1099-18 TaxID=1397361 RepID=A0A0F2MF10_SPOSC|nr:Histidine Kinase A (phosphoacceptor) domain containing protein [Sporothrix schenckii 1099-18]KJR88217.1 Histidine Kinase A (phosphoacceptor) domain containing protein [Sporothrix schenckii 1099-18]
MLAPSASDDGSASMPNAALDMASSQEGTPVFTDGSDIDVCEIFDLSPVASAILSPTFQIVRASRSFLAVLGLETKNCVGRDILVAIEDQVLLSNNDRVRIKTILQASINLRAVQTLSGRSTSTGAAVTGLGVDLAWSLRTIPVFRNDVPYSVVFEWTHTQSTSTSPTVEPMPSLPPTVPPLTVPLASEAQSTFIPEPDYDNFASNISIDEAFGILVRSVKDYAIFLMDTEGYIMTWNAGAEMNKGYTKKEIIGKHFSIFYGPKDIADNKPQRELEDCLRYGRIEDEGWRFRKDGSRFWANVTITAIYKGGVHVGFGKVTRNMTERRAAEVRVLAAYEESAKLKSDFVANMSHEICTPMHGMLSACSLLLDTALTPEQREIASIIDESGQVLLHVINDILDYSKLASGSFSIHTDIVGIGSIVTSVVRSIEPSLPPDVRLQLALASDLPRAVQGDPLRYRQIVQNIVGNAKKFTDKGIIRVAVTVQDQDEDTFTIHTRVTDSGIGIPKNASHSLFMPFTQVDTTTKKRFQGTGLGLSICKSLVELMGGTIGFTPNPDGHGSIFWFSIRFLKIKSLSQLNMTDVEGKTNKRLAHRGALTTPGQELAQFELEKAQTIPPPLERIAKKVGLSKAEVASGSGFDLIEDDGDTSPMPGGEIVFTPEASSDSVQSDFSSPITTPPNEGTSPPVAEAPLPESKASPVSNVDNYSTPQSPLYPAETITPISSISLPALTIPLMDLLSSSTRGNKSVDRSTVPEDPQARLQTELEQNVALLRKRAPGKRILVAEDNTTNQRILLRILASFGFDTDCVTVASDGSQAVKHVIERSKDFDLCFMDISMPVMDGHEATVQIRKNGIQLPIIAMTAYALKGDREQCLAFGMDDYVSKPVNKRLLVDKILTWLPA